MHSKALHLHALTLWRKQVLVMRVGYGKRVPKIGHVTLGSKLKSCMGTLGDHCSLFAVGRWGRVVSLGVAIRWESSCGSDREPK